MTDWDFKQRVLEANVEDQVVAWAANNGWVCRKMQYVGRRDCPDRFFFGYGKIVPIEFKKPGKGLRASQAHEHARLAHVGVEVFVHTTFEGAVETLRGFM